MGGRGGNSGGISPSGGEVSRLMTRVQYNASKKSDALRSDRAVKIDRKLERSAQNGNLEFIDKITFEKEAQRVKNYYQDRINDTSRQIAKLESANDLYENHQDLAKTRRNLMSAVDRARVKLHEFSQAPEKADPTAFHAVETTTYQRARNRRIKNFDAWFYGK